MVRVVLSKFNWTPGADATMFHWGPGEIVQIRSRKDPNKTTLCRMVDGEPKHHESVPGGEGAVEAPRVKEAMSPLEHIRGSDPIRLTAVRINEIVDRVNTLSATAPPLDGNHPNLTKLKS